MQHTRANSVKGWEGAQNGNKCKTSQKETASLENKQNDHKETQQRTEYQTPYIKSSTRMPSDYKDVKTTIGM